MNIVSERAPVEGTRLLVLLALADQANDEGLAYPAVTTLAQRARVGREAARKHLRALEADGILETQQGRGGRFDPNGKGPGGRSVYALTDPARWPSQRDEWKPRKPRFPDLFEPSQLGFRSNWSDFHEAQAAATPPPAGGGTPPPAGGGTPPPAGGATHQVTHEVTPQRAAPGAAECGGDEDPEGFGEWWAIYPRKLDRPKARAAYAAVLREGRATPEQLLKGAKAYAVDRQGVAKRWVKGPAAWLENNRWTDFTTIPDPRNAAAAGVPADQARALMMERAMEWIGRKNTALAAFNKDEFVREAVKRGLVTVREARELGYLIPSDLRK
jgi:DNA-binding transcriptional ArsR family regulator